MKTDILDLTSDQMRSGIISMGEPPHRAAQIFRWLWRKNVRDFTEMTDIPKDLAAKLAKKFFAGEIELADRLRSKDGTEKFLWRLEDGFFVESVLIKEGKRRTACLSTQVGCRFRCPFCASGQGGFKRDLKMSEIADQIAEVQKITGCRVTNVVFMGMGEPLDNYDNLVRALEVINSPSGLGIGARKITVSTCGIVPGILKLKDLPLQAELSVSLHGATDRVRNSLVPAGKKYPLEKLIKACERYYEDTGRVITLEYTLIKGRNDLVFDAEELAKVAKRLKAKVNLIACNAFPGSGLQPASSGATELFRKILRSNRVTVTVRKSKGEDILAACGQLAARRRG